MGNDEDSPGMASGSLDTEMLRGGGYERELLEAGVPAERVPQFGYNPVNRRANVYRPILDERYLDAGGDRPEWPGDSQFAVCLTHDVDHVTRYPGRAALSRWLQRAKSALGTGSGTALYRAVEDVAKSTLRRGYAATGGENRYHRYERWLEVEKSVGARSTFFFLPDVETPPHRSDHLYRYDDPVRFDDERRTVAEMMREIDSQEFEIGLHATWHAYDDPDRLRTEKERVESVLGHEIESVRQHWLHYDARITPRAHADAGFRYDSTLGLKGNVGFRSGTSYPWQLTDGTDQRGVLEVPPVIAEGTLLKPTNMGVDPDIAFEYIQRLATAVKSVGGVLTLLWHPSSVANSEWFDLYAKVLAYLDDEGAWFGTVQEVGDWWRDHNRQVQTRPESTASDER